MINNPNTPNEILKELSLDFPYLYLLKKITQHINCSVELKEEIFNKMDSLNYIVNSIDISFSKNNKELVFSIERDYFEDMNIKIYDAFTNDSVENYIIKIKKVKLILNIRKISAKKC